MSRVLRPRTRVYDCNYNIGESYYRPALDRLDRKYSGRPTTPPRRAPSLPRDLLDRHEAAFADEDLPSARRRAEKHITEEAMFDSRGARTAALGRPLSVAFDMDNDMDEEMMSTLSRIRNRKKATAVDDTDMESLSTNISSRRMLNKAENLLDSVGLSLRDREEEPRTSSIARRKVLRITQTAESDGDASQLTRWSALREDDHGAAALRAKQSKARLQGIEDEMEAVAARQVARERRAANLRSLVAENAEETRAVQAALKVRAHRSEDF